MSSINLIFLVFLALGINIEGQKELLVYNWPKTKAISSSELVLPELKMIA